MYEALILVDPSSVVSAQQLAHGLEQFHKDKEGAPSSIEIDGDVVSLRWPAYEMRVALCALPHVLEESEEMATRPGRPVVKVWRRLTP